MGQQFGPISSQELRNLAQHGTISSYMGRILLACIIALVTQLLPVKQGFCAEGPSAKNSPSASIASVDLEKKIYQLVKDLEYSDQVAQDFVRMVRPWKCDVLYQKLCQAAEDVKQKKISWNQYAQVEEEVVNQLAQKINNEITGDLDSNSKYYDLIFVIKDKKAQCLGCTQLFYILGNSMGLTIQAINVLEHSKGQMPAGWSHVACAIGLHNGKAMQVDLTLRDCVSRAFLFTEEYGKSGNYWEFKDKNNRLDIHPRIQLLDKNALAAHIYCNRGNTFGKAGKLIEAISDFNKAIELNPKYAQAYCNRGQAYTDSGKADKAITNCTKAIELNPKFALAYNNRGNAYDDLGKSTEAISDFTKAIALNPKCAEAYNNRGTAYTKSGQLDKAIAEYTKAIELNPNYAEAYVNRGVTNVTLGKMEDAKKDLRKAMKLNPGLKESVKKISDHFKLDL